MTPGSNRCPDIIACTSEIISHGISKRQWCAKIFFRGPSKTQRSKINPFRKSWVQTNDLQRLRKRDWTSSLLSLRVKCTQNDGEHGVWPNKCSWLELQQRKENTASILHSKRESPWLFIIKLTGGWLCVNSNPSASKSEESLYHNHSSSMSSWESNVNVGNIFKELSVNMVSTNHSKNENEEMI